MMAMTAMAGHQSAVRGCQQSFRSPRRSNADRVQCAAVPERQQQQQQQQSRDFPGMTQLAAGLAAAVLVHSAPANAGVVLQKNELKKVFQFEDAPAPVKKAAAQVGPGVAGPAPSLPGVPSISAPSLPSLPSPGNLGGSSLLALPLTIGGLVAGAFAWKTIDPGFSAFFDTALAKNSNSDGAGYENAILNGQMAKKGGGGSGTKKVAKKAAKKGEKTKKKGLLSF